MENPDTWHTIQCTEQVRIPTQFQPQLVIKLPPNLVMVTTTPRVNILTKVTHFYATYPKHSPTQQTKLFMQVSTNKEVWIRAKCWQASKILDRSRFHQ